mmetsp:Transcript_53376/g.171025  ORF Transcript_53376/g.171025 Transcript_53376/m.171025 type:complete len:207 (+) Transcript_53376:236-856(+)
MLWDSHTCKPVQTPCLTVLVCGRSGMTRGLGLAQCRLNENVGRHLQRLLHVALLVLRVGLKRQLRHPRDRLRVLRLPRLQRVLRVVSVVGAGAVERSAAQGRLGLRGFPGRQHVRRVCLLVGAGGLEWDCRPGPARGGTRRCPWRHWVPRVVEMVGAVGVEGDGLWRTPGCRLALARELICLEIVVVVRLGCEGCRLGRGARLRRP